MAVHRNSLANLQKGLKFGAGQPINRGGAPKGKRFKTYLKNITNLRLPYKDMDGVSNILNASEIAILALIERAVVHGDINAIEFIMRNISISTPNSDKAKHTAEVTNDILKQAGINY
jgi:hypothetical protein